MVQVILRGIDDSINAIQCSREICFLHTSHQIPTNCYLVVNGRVVNNNYLLSDYDTVTVFPRLCGGKGGFGSMLRAIGAQIEATTNNDACRDLSGKRLRDVKCEKMLKEWSEKQKSEKGMEREKLERKRQRLQKILDGPSHIKSQDNTYITEIRSNSESVESAIETAMQQDDNVPAVKPKKAKKWYGDSDSSDDEEQTNGKTSHELNTETALSDISSGHGEIKIRFINNTDAPDDSEDNTCSNDTPSESKDKIENSNEKEIVVSETCIASVPILSDIKYDKSENESDKNENKYQDVHASGGSPISEDSPTDPMCSWKDLKSVSELLELGGDVLKTILSEMGLKCGGTPQMRAERLLSVRNLNKDQIDPSLFSTSGKGRKRKNKT